MRILYLTTRLPYAPNRGDRIRSYYVLREMSRFAEVSVFSLVHDDEEARHATDVPFATHVVTTRPRRLPNLLRAVTRLHTATPLTHLLFATSDARARLDAQGFAGGQSGKRTTAGGEAAQARRPRRAARSRGTSAASPPGPSG